MTYSMPQSMNSPLPARKRAPTASANTTGKPSRNGSTGRPTSAMPIAPTATKPIPTVATFSRLSRVNTLSVDDAACVRISAPSVPATERDPVAASLAAAVWICLRSCVASASFKDWLSATMLCCPFDSASRAMEPSALSQFGVSSSICSLVVQRNVGTMLRRSATFH
jgi:hypothetical protein